MKDTENLQKILLGVFLVVILLAIGVFAGYIPIGKINEQRQDGFLTGELEIWGVLSPSTVTPALKALEEKNENKLKLTYVQKGLFEIETEYTEALAKNSGPDLVLFTNFQLLTMGDKFLQIPYDSFPRSRFEQEYIESAHTFLSPVGIIGLPFAQDPLVMYYNKDILAQNYLFEPPKYWDEYEKFAQDYTIRDGLNVSRSAVALGAFTNLAYPVDILSLMFLQTRNPIGTPFAGSYRSTLNQNFIRSNLNVSAEMLKFFNGFSNPDTLQYSWNRVKNSDRQEFLAGRLAVYFGYASDSANFLNANPNLNVGVAKVPQIRDFPEATISRIYAFGINPRSENVQLSLSVMWELSGRVFGTFIGSQFGMQPIFKNQIAPRADISQTDLVFQQSAFMSRSWPDPNPTVTFGIFREMVEDTISGVLDEEQAIRRATLNLDRAYEETLR